MSLFGGLLSIGSSLVSAIGNAVETAKDMVSSGAQKVAEVVSKIGSTVTEGASYVASTIQETASKAVEVAEKIGSTVITKITSDTSAPKAQQVAETASACQQSIPSGVTSNTNNSAEVTKEPRYSPGIDVGLGTSATAGMTQIASQKTYHTTVAPGSGSQIENEILSKVIPTEPATQEQVAQTEQQAIAEIQQNNKSKIEEFMDLLASIPERAWAEIKQLAGIAKEKAEDAVEKVVETAKTVTQPITAPIKTFSEGVASAINAVRPWLLLILAVALLVGVAYFVRTFKR